MDTGSYVRIGSKYAKEHKYEYAVGCGAKIHKISSMMEIPYAVVDLVEHPPMGQPHRFLVATIDLVKITERQARFRLIK